MAEEERMAELIPAEVFSPGEFLSEELEARGWSQQELAEILGRPANAVSQIINGKRAITPATAKELAAALGTSPMLWMSLDASYRLHRSEPAPKRIAVEARIRSLYPIRDMIQRGWIEHSETPEVLETRVLEYFGLKSLNETPHFAIAARAGTKGSLDLDLSNEQLAWLFRVRNVAEAMQIGSYSESKLRNAMSRLEVLMSAPEEIRHVPRLLEDCGVRFVVVEPLPGSKIDGVCFWLNAGQPVVGMTLRLDRIDNFWFVLRHELEHVLRQDAALDSDLAPGPAAISEQERAANEAAASFGVPEQALDNFIMRVQPLFSEHSVLAFAMKHRVHPGIVVGRLQHRLDRFNFLRKHLVGVREYVVPAATTDGYGRCCPV
jgi:HTH-type transcriptional regulator/antitoxin HigA